MRLQDIPGRFRSAPSHIHILVLSALGLPLLMAGYALWWHYAGIPYGIQDPDVWLRLVRVWQWHDGGGWYDRVITRMNAPYGLENHWTRPLDVLLLALAWPASFFGYSYQNALLFAAIVASPVLWWVAMAGMLSICRSLSIGATGQWMAACVMFTDSLIRSPFMVGRADHHSLLLALFVWMLAYLIQSRVGVAAVLAGLGLWVSPEFLVAIGLTAAVYGTGWAITGELAQLRAVRRFFFGTLLVAIAALVLEWLPGAWLTVTHIRISIVHVNMLAVGLSVAILLQFLAPKPAARRSRFAVAAVLAACALAWLMHTYPRFYEGPMADTPPELVAVFSQQLELRTIFALLGIVGGLGIIASTLLGLSGYVMRLREKPRDVPVWLLFVMALAYSLLMVKMIRWSSYAMIAVIPAWAMLAERLMVWIERRRDIFKSQLKHTPMLAAITLLVIARDVLYLPSAMEDKSLKIAPSPCLPKLTQLIEAGIPNMVIKSEGVSDVVLTHLDVSGQLIFWTPLRVMGSNYANYNVDGIRDVDRFMFAQDAGEALAIVKKHDVGLVMVCLPDLFAPFVTVDPKPEPLFLRDVAAGKRPKWLIPVEGDLPEGMLLLKVRPPHER